MSLVSMLYNVQLMKYAGEDGISAYGVLMYVSMVFQAIFVGYSVGVAPIESYHLGAENHRELRACCGAAWACWPRAPCACSRRARCWPLPCPGCMWAMTRACSR